MMRDHERIEELIAVRALGGLDPEDEATLGREMASHGPGCPECRRLEVEYAEVSGRLAISLDPVAPRPGLEDETLARALGLGEAPAEPRGGAAARLRPLVAVAAALAVFAVGLVAGMNVSEEGGVPSGATVVSFQGEAGTLAVAYTPGEPGVYLLGTQLPVPERNRVYALWRFVAGEPRPMTCLRPTDDGSLFARVDAELDAAELLAVTIEDAACPSAPTSDPVYVAEIATA